jgi:hypothetical protein
MGWQDLDGRMPGAAATFPGGLAGGVFVEAWAAAWEAVGDALVMGLYGGALIA